jgi:hypothetical protein
MDEVFNELRAWKNIGKIKRYVAAGRPKKKKRPGVSATH